MKKKKIVSVDNTLGITNEYTVKCQHQFFKITDEVKSKEDNMTRVPIRWGVKIMCAFCGEQRILWTDGEVETL